MTSAPSDPGFPFTWRWGAVIGLVAFAGFGVFLMLVQIMLVLLSPAGSWHRPGWSRVEITLLDKDEEGRLNGKAWGKVDGEFKALRFDKGEAAKLRVDDEVWVLDNYFAGGVRPDQFILTPWRLVLEYPAPLVALALLLAWRLRRTQARLDAIVPDIPRKVWKDDFHERSRRFAERKPEEP
jgi:hypothetical protein